MVGNGEYGRLGAEFEVFGLADNTFRCLYSSEIVFDPSDLGELHLGYVFDQSSFLLVLLLALG